MDNKPFSDWISVDDQLPPDGELVLMHSTKQTIEFATGYIINRDDGLMWMFNGTSAHESIKDFGVDFWQEIRRKPNNGS